MAYQDSNRTFNRNAQVNTHEILKREIYKQGDDPGFKYAISASPTSPNTIISTAPNSTGIADTYLYFDSINRDTSSDLTNGHISFAIAPLNNSQPIEQCVSVRLGDFYFPQVKNATTSPDFYFFRRVYGYITTITSTQAFLGPNRNQFHFEFEVESNNSVAVRLIPVNPAFYFRQPITSMNTFEMRFMVPNGTGGFRNVPLPTDTLVVTAVPGSNPATFTIGAGQDIGALYDLALIPGTYPGTPITLTTPVAVYFSAFSSSNSTINSAVISPQGLFVTTLKNNIYTFEIGSLDFTALTTSVTTNMYVAKNKISIPVRFTSVTTSNNYVSLVHD